jgi:hypothetical protein
VASTLKPRGSKGTAACSKRARDECEDSHKQDRIGGTGELRGAMEVQTKHKGGMTGPGSHGTVGTHGTVEVAKVIIAASVSTATAKGAVAGEDTEVSGGSTMGKGSAGPSTGYVHCACSTG